MCSWKIFTITFRGKLHEKENTKCQDSVYGSNSGDTVILALSDGAGSARLSHIGSKIVVSTFAGLLRSNFEKFYRDEYPYKIIIERINKNFSKSAIKYDVEPKELSATLVGLAMKDSRYFFIHMLLIGTYKPLCNLPYGIRLTLKLRDRHNLYQGIRKEDFFCLIKFFG